MKKKIIGGVIIIALIVIVPIFLDSCILGNDIKSNVGNDIWMAFFGSYFGGLFGAVATLLVLYDTQKSRKRAEKRSKKKQKKQQKLSIRPCLQVRERVVNRDETINQNSNNVYYVLYEKGNTKHWRNYSQVKKLLQKTLFIIEVELNNVGMGSAVMLNAFIEDEQFLFNESLGVGQTLKLYYLLKENELAHKEIKIVFKYGDSMGLVQYRQEEVMLIKTENGTLTWEHSQYLTLPQTI